MTEPVLIIHGINNHNFAPFAKQVDKLQQVLGQGKRLIPVYWGDLGGQSTHLADCLPAFTDGQWRVRASEDTSVAPGAQAIRAVVGPGDGLNNAERADLVSEEVQQESLVRGLEGTHQQRVREAVVGELATTRVLQYMDDRETLAIVGRAIDGVLRDLQANSAAQPPSPPAGGFSVGGTYDVRGAEETPSEIDTRGLIDSIGRVAAHVVQGIDEALGRVIGTQLGRLNQGVRERLALPISATLGDIMSYQRQPDRIQDTLRAALAEHAPGHGGKDRPISVIAHSLGGVVAFDAAVNPVSEGKRLWIKSFVTFGSQAAFFHIVDPRTPQLAPYQRDVPVNLPPSIARWTNLWDPMDLLAFTAGTVFRLADGSKPLDLHVEDSVSELVAQKGWAHSVYWESDELASALRSALG